MSLIKNFFAFFAVIFSFSVLLFVLMSPPQLAAPGRTDSWEMPLPINAGNDATQL